MSENVIPFNAPERLLAKVNNYICAVDQLISDGDEAIDLLLTAFEVADDDLKIKIVLLLGALANAEVVTPLVSIMRESDHGESIRQAAAIQLSVVGGTIRDRGNLVDTLLKELQSNIPFERANAAFALGWEGNLRATPSLIDCLFDEETEVQQAAVCALSNLGEEKIFSVLAERLQKSPKEQQRTILYHLGHFASRHDEIVQICNTFINHDDADLRYDALVVLNTVSEPNENIALYERCIRDNDARIRELTLTHLGFLDRETLLPMEPLIRALLKDDKVNVHQAAIRLIHQIHPTTLVSPLNASNRTG